MDTPLRRWVRTLFGSGQREVTAAEAAELDAREAKERRELEALTWGDNTWWKPL